MSDILRLARRIGMTVGIGRQTADTDESRGSATMQVALGGDELRDNVPHTQMFGFASRPIPGSDVVVLFQGGNRRQGTVIASGHQPSRPRDLASGEVCVFHPSSGARVWFRSDGSIRIVPAGAPVEIDGDLVVTGKVTAADAVFAGITQSTHEHTNGNNGGNTGHPVAG
ncbi:phage baseplate assembly protein domain-containing protein [Rhizosaccharibacter radicis]|uniref:Phage baseplate assembly protein n=1 Tax=Rhizosaccharibacter radicis TaxID=2782605 RepID=A0ABT1VW02_9PROT|nr:phage baseplate assembly protein [Acetobacteraceae bacterium KSS12]